MGQFRDRIFLFMEILGRITVTLSIIYLFSYLDLILSNVINFIFGAWSIIPIHNYLKDNKKDDR